MLYPVFNDLVAYKNRKQNKTRVSTTVISQTPGQHRSPFRGHGLEFDSVREYVAGDDIRHIDWRVTARMGAPHLKILREERERQRMIVVDMNAVMRFGTKKTFKSVQAAHIASWLGWQGLSENDRVGACLYGDVPNGIQFFSPMRTSSSFCSILQSLSEAPKESHLISCEQVLEPLARSIKSGSLVYFISDFMEIPSKALLSRIAKKSEVIFIALHDPMDKSLYPYGSLGFSAAGSAPLFIDTSNNKARLSYEEDWNLRRKSLYSLAADLKVTILELSTESNIASELHFGLRGKRCKT
jgi:uncharacterized protein (DUF58 family)